jgi:hypothetical protein
MADQIYEAQNIASLVQGVVWSLLAILLAWKGLPALFALVHELGFWRGTIGARLEGIEKDVGSQLEEVRCGFRENREQHRAIFVEQHKHGERLATIEANGHRGATGSPAGAEGTGG